MPVGKGDKGGWGMSEWMIWFSLFVIFIGLPLLYILLYG